MDIEEFLSIAHPFQGDSCSGIAWVIPTGISGKEMCILFCSSFPGLHVNALSIYVICHLAIHHHNKLNIVMPVADTSVVGIEG